ncbi:hypothetical protein GQ457_16G022010 [Hibiscus cannabinus]
MEITDFQILVNRVSATKVKKKAIERRKSGYRSDKKVKRDDRPSWPSKKAKHHHEGSSTYTPAPRNKFTPKPQSVNKSSFPVMSVNSTRNSEKTAPCQYCKKPHWRQCSITPANWNKSLKQAKSVVQGRGKGSHSSAPTHQESRALTFI